MHTIQKRNKKAAHVGRAKALAEEEELIRKRIRIKNAEDKMT